MPHSKILLPILGLLAIVLVYGLGMITAQRYAGTGISSCQILDRALAAYPGELVSVQVTKPAKTPIWNLVIDGKDGKRYLLAYDTKNGDLLNFASN